MSHLDESTLHALLDGELESADARQASAHLERCTHCETRLDQVRVVRTEADRLVDSLGSHSAAAPASMLTAVPPDERPTPVLLIPDLPDAVLRRQRHIRAIGWAAAIVVLAGVGYVAFGARRDAQFAIAGPDADRTWIAPAPRTDSAVLSPEETPSRTPPVADPSELPLDTAANALQPTEPPAPTPSAARLEADRLAREREALQREADRLAAEREAASRLAAEQLAAERRAAAERRSAAASPPTLEQRAQIYLRIGLDEAVRQLGSPMHGIEGMSPTVVGLVQGKLSPGMDVTRPVVRAVYLDPAGRLIFLDQQTLRSGQAGGAETQTRQVIGNVVVLLHGEPSAEVLRNLASRVR